MNENKLSAWLTLSFTPAIGSKSFSKLVAIDSVENIVNYPTKNLEMLGFNNSQIDYIKHKAKKEIEACLFWQQQSPSHRIITLLDSEYPRLLKQINLPPPVLFVKGKIDVLSEPQIAIVGSRNASVDGLNNAKLFAGDLARKGITVTSGMALGVDGHAHDGALKSGGETIAVLGSGLNNIYPAKHRVLSERIVESGVLVSEFRPNGVARPENFPRRNRIISGLSMGVLVVEATKKSGSLITARYAMEQGREVFALPGSIHNPLAKGGNALIKDGANLVQSSNEMLKEIDVLLNWSLNSQKELFADEVSNEQLPFSLVLANVGEDEAISVDILAQRTHISVHEIMIQLLELELQGQVAAVSGGYIRTRRT
ncbi:DNA-processing protein DprA [Vibrio sp. MA40-2]|uniref:DNA-processing protein DprA n=1 Tax=Vibrio sp. MA40-2 TaxID=3391828 RepID=UPI0039A4A2AF